jgi:hypothetical protein
MQVGFGIVTVVLGGKRRSVVSASGAARLLESDEWTSRSGPAFKEACRVIAAALEGYCTHRAAAASFRKAAREAGIAVELEQV